MDLAGEDGRNPADILAVIVEPIAAAAGLQIDRPAFEAARIACAERRHV